MRTFLITAAVACALLAVGLTWGWEFGIFDDRAWRQHASGWGWLSFASFAASCHPWAGWADKYLDGRASQP